MFPTRVVFASLLAAVGIGAHSVEKRAEICNGAAELCTKPYSQVSYVGAHNSYAVDATSLSANQEYDVTQQLKNGIRLLQLQAHSSKDGIHLCHESCFLYEGGTMADYLIKVKAWLDDNPNEVLTILVVNIDNQPAASFAAVYEAVGLADVAFVPEVQPLPYGSWPTLGSMIDSGKRLVTFLDNSADTVSVPYLLDEFTQIWETAFDVTEASWPCAVNRTAVEVSNSMYLINHFLYSVTDIVGTASSIAPNKEQLLVTNAATGPGSLGQEVDNCVAQWTRPPTFLLVDFYHYGGGSVFEAAATINGVTYTPTSAVPKPLESDHSSSNGSENQDDDVTTTPLDDPLEDSSASRVAFAFSAVVAVAFSAGASFF